MDLDEPRRPRLTTSHPATYRPRRDADIHATPVVGEVMDISESGFRLRTSQELAVGAEIDLEIVVAGEPLFARGRVVRASRAEDGRFDCGLRWNGIPTETLYALLYGTS
jgi:hypothetical protein